MGLQFDRQYRFSAGQAGGVGFEVGVTDPVALHISFNVQKADVSSANTSKITLWNLNKAQLSTLNEKDCIVTLKAGYGATMPLIFVGAVSRVETTVDGADRMTEIEAIDGRIELRDTFVSLSYKGVISAKKVMQDVAQQMGVSVTFSYNATFADYPNGFSFIGAGKTALDKVCAPTDLIWEIQNGILQIKRKGDVMSKQVFVLSPDSGLIGIPKKLTQGAENDTDENSKGWEAVYLLNGAIGVGDYVKIESETVTGFFRVHTVEHDGDNIEGDWLSTAHLYELTAKEPAAAPAADSGKDGNADIAREVIRGDWGNGQERVDRLTAAGYDYSTIQGIVNQMLNGTYTG